MDDKVRALVNSMIENARRGRVVPANKAMLVVRDKYTRAQALGNGRITLEYDEIAAREYDSRVTEWLGIVVRVADDLQIAWTSELALDMRHLLELELSKDWDESYSRLEQFNKGGRSLRMGELEATKNRAIRRIENELALRVLASDRTRLPIAQRLSADRYRAVLNAWEKASGMLDGQSPDLANAVKDAVGAVESLARLVISDPTATLGQAIKVLQVEGRLRPPVLKGLEELWGWTSSEPGVRHAATEEPLRIEDARYFFKLAEAALDRLLGLDTK